MERAMHAISRFGVLSLLFVSAACGGRSLSSARDGAAGGHLIAGAPGAGGAGSGGAPGLGGAVPSVGGSSGGDMPRDGGQDASLPPSDASDSGGNADVPWDFLPPLRDGAVILLDVKLAYDDVLDAAEAERIHSLGAGLGCDLQPEQDLRLVRRGMRATDPDLRDWAYLAVEKMATCPGLLDGPFVDDVFPYFMAAMAGSDLEAAQYAIRGFGDLATFTNLLTRDQVDQAYALGVRLRAGSDVEARINGTNLLGSLIHTLDAEQMHDTFADLLSSFEKWRASYSGLLAYPSDADRQTASDYQAAKFFLYSCSYVQDAAQASDGFHALSTALASGRLDVTALPSVAGLVRLLAEPERGQAVDLVIAGLADPKGWYSLGSGIYIPANHAAAALEVVEPLLTQDEIRRAIAAMTTQSAHPDYAQVFGPAVERLRSRLPDAG
jgi:hypothetical protein